MTTVKTTRMAAQPAARESVTPGTSSPLGATPCREGVNFSVFSKHATGMELLLFDASKAS